MEPRINQLAGSCPLAMLSLSGKHATRVADRLDTRRHPFATTIRHAEPVIPSLMTCWALQARPASEVLLGS
jgi:hypothetical protein